ATRKFTLVLKRDADGRYIPEVEGFYFLGSYYHKIN
ncbi:MAG: hypothetical protein JWN14_3941, partial [Chthonomonadales bacterium]|nr:hypothetical protein [Chthonomonadales bacterium]